MSITVLYTFNDTLNDSSGHELSGISMHYDSETLSASSSIPVFDTGLSGNALSLSADDFVYVEYDDLLNLNPYGTYVMEMYIKPAVILPGYSGYQAIVVKNWQADYWRWGIWLFNDEILVGSSSPAETNNIVTVGANITANTWYKIKYTYYNGHHRIYVNDVLQTLDYTDTASHEEPIYIFVGNEGTMSIGTRQSSVDTWEYFYTGLIENFSITDRTYLRVVKFTTACIGNPIVFDLDYGDGSAHATELPATHEYDVSELEYPYTVNVTLVASKEGTCSTKTKSIDLAAY